MSDPDSSTANPYAPTLLLGVSDDDESIRRAHLNCEISVRTIGTVYVMSGCLAVVVGIVMLQITTDEPSLRSGDLFMRSIMVTVSMVGGLIWIMVGLCVRAIRPWSRVPAIVISVIGLFAFPIGTLMAAIFLVTLLSRKGKYVLSDEYLGVIERTQHINRRSWVTLAAVIVGFVVLVLLCGV